MVVNGVEIKVERKSIKDLHLAVSPPNGRVHVSAPQTYTDEQIKFFVLKKWGWFVQKRKKTTSYTFQDKCKYVSSEAHYYKGELYRLKIIRDNTCTFHVETQGDYINVYVYGCTPKENIANFLWNRYKEQLIPTFRQYVSKWENILDVKVADWTIQQMQSSWGKCHKDTGKIMFNLQLAKKPLNCIEYVVVHELTHLIEQNHTDKFHNILVTNLPRWQKIKEQKATAIVLLSMDKEISTFEAKREKYTAIKKGMMQQLLTGKIRLVETSVKTNATSANVHFRRSVLAVESAKRVYDEPIFGHVKMEKMLFLTECLCHIDVGSHYHRDAVGSHENNSLRSIDNQLKKQKWFKVQRTEKGYRYVPIQNRGKHKTYFNRYYFGVVSMFDKIINTLKSKRTERCGIVATLYSAWEDLLRSNKPLNDAYIVNEVLDNWYESKKRISQDCWLKAI